MATDATLHDVAAIAHVSPRTVSRVVNGESGFSAATRLRVEAAIEMVGYRPNLLARALITRRTGTIGFVCHDITDPFFAELADGTQRAARERGQTMFVSIHDNDPALQRDLLERLHSFAVDGVIAFTARGDRSDLIRLAGRGVPTIVIDVDIDAPNITSIVSDIGGGAVMAVEHLVDRGRRVIGQIGNSDSDLSSMAPRREGGYRKALHDAGLPYEPDLVVRDLPNFDGGRRAMARLLDARPDVDAVFAYNDTVAIGAMQTLAAHGRIVPDDVAVVGFDDIAMSGALRPALSTVRIDRQRLGRVAVDELAKRIEVAGLPPRRVQLDVELVVRGSS